MGVRPGRVRRRIKVVRPVRKRWRRVARKSVRASRYSFESWMDDARLSWPGRRIAEGSKSDETDDEVE